MEKKHWRDVYKSDYLASWDLDAGQVINLTIDKCVCEQANVMGKPEKVILYFKEKEYKPMICNASNSKIMQKLTQTGNFADWAGTRISVFAEEKRSKDGSATDGLSIKPKSPALPKPKEKLTPDHIKWNDVVSSMVRDNNEPSFYEEWFTITEENKTLLSKQADNARV